MDFYVISSLMLTFAILIAYFNHRYIKMQSTIAMMVSALFLSLLLIISSEFGYFQFEHKVLTVLSHLDFEKLLINGMLSFLLFAGALTIDIHTLKAQRWEIFTLASLSTVASAFLIGTAVYFLLPAIGFHLGFIYCLLFGALISPTDPIAVLATFKQLRVPKMLDTTVAGESLFNDGVGIVMFLALYHLAFTNEPVTTYSVTLLFLQQALGGIIYGLALGFAGSWLIKNSTDPKFEILITLAMASGGYALAQALNLSGPLAIVVAGIVVGSYAKQHAMTEKGQAMLDEFWELLDEILNCILFLLIGFELLVVAKNNHYFIAALFAIPLVLFVRYLTVAIPISIFKRWRSYCPHMISILVWGGVRGGLAVALALALPASENRQLILAMTYMVVAFAVIVQGMTIKPLVKFTQSDHGRHPTLSAGTKDIANLEEV